MNSKSRINRLQFAKVFWDYAAEGNQAEAAEKPGGSPGKFPDPLEKSVSPCEKMDGSVIPPSPAKQVQGKRAATETRDGFKDRFLGMKLFPCRCGWRR